MPQPTFRVTDVFSTYAIAGSSRSCHLFTASILSLFIRFVDILGPEDFLAPVCTLMVDKAALKYAKTRDAALISLPLGVYQHFSGTLQLNVSISTCLKLTFLTRDYSDSLYTTKSWTSSGKPNFSTQIQPKGRSPAGIVVRLPQPKALCSQSSRREEPFLQCSCSSRRFCRAESFRLNCNEQGVSQMFRSSRSSWLSSRLPRH